MRKFCSYPSKPHSGQARIRLPGAKKHTYLGAFGSPESWAEYQRLLAAWRTGQLSNPLSENPGSDNRLDNSAPRTVRELVSAYLRWAERHYTDQDGTVRGELATVRAALKPLVTLHGHTPVSDFGPRALKGLLATCAAGNWHAAEDANKAQSGRKEAAIKPQSRPWCRRVANANLARWRAVWKWAESEELVPAGTYHQLQTVRGLQPGQAAEREEVPPVPEEHFRAALPHLGPIVRQAVELLALTGARPSELLRLTPGDIDRGGSVELARGYRVQLPAGVWCYQPRAHKTARKGKRRVILFGPSAQKILEPLLAGLAAESPVFSPRRAREKRLLLLRAARRSKVPPSQVSRARPGARQPAERYTANGLRLAVARACRRAGVPAFSCYQIRHLAATKLTAQFGIEVARLVLGHEDVRMTQIYSLNDIAKAAEAIGKVG